MRGSGSPEGLLRAGVMNADAVVVLADSSKFANEGKEADTQVVMTMLNIRGKLCSDVRLFSELNNGSYMRHAGEDSRFFVFVCLY